MRFVLLYHRIHQHEHCLQNKRGKVIELFMCYEPLRSSLLNCIIILFFLLAEPTYIASFWYILPFAPKINRRGSYCHIKITLVKKIHRICKAENRRYLNIVSLNTFPVLLKFKKQTYHSIYAVVYNLSYLLPVMLTLSICIDNKVCSDKEKKIG